MRPVHDPRCSCELRGPTLAFDYTTAEITARLVCVGTQGRRSCGYLGPVMTLEEAEVFLALAWARTCLQDAAAPRSAAPLASA
jgi:hypothetical protein